jgi:activator of 2-hydroxyglutaryl-CoA dehydratase
MSAKHIYYGKSGILRYVQEGGNGANIAAGINYAMAERASSLVKRAGFGEDVCITGRVAENMGAVKKSQGVSGVCAQALGLDRRIVGSIAAGILARGAVCSQNR